MCDNAIKRVRNDIMAYLADGHWWTAGELSDTIDCATSAVQSWLDWFEEAGFVEKFDNEEPTMYGWTVEPQAVARHRASA